MLLFCIAMADWTAFDESSAWSLFGVRSDRAAVSLFCTESVLADAADGRGRDGVCEYVGVALCDAGASAAAGEELFVYGDL